MFQFNLRREVWEQHNADWWVRGHKRAFKHALLRLPLWFLLFCFVLFLSEKPFYLREVYLPTNCTDCILAYEEVISGQNTFTSLLLFSRAAMTLRLGSIVSTDLKTWSHFLAFVIAGKTKNVSSAVVEDLERKATCLKMPPPIIVDSNYGQITHSVSSVPCTRLLMYPSRVCMQICAQRTSHLLRGSVPSTPYLKPRWAMV